MIILVIILGVILIVVGLGLLARTNVPIKEEPKPKEAREEFPRDEIEFYFPKGTAFYNGNQGRYYKLPGQKRVQILELYDDEMEIRD